MESINVSSGSDLPVHHKKPVSVADNEGEWLYTNDPERKRRTHDSSYLTEANTAETALKLLVCGSCGFLFGFLIEKSRVFEPFFIRAQLSFTSVLMLKMFLTASSFSMLSLLTLSLTSFSKAKFYRALDSFAVPFVKSNDGNPPKGFFSVAIGALILGGGMSLCGACPGMVLAQIGGGIPQALVTFIGCLWGAFVYGLIEPLITQFFENLDSLVPMRTLLLSETLKAPFIILAIPMAAIMLGLVTALELIWPWDIEVYQGTAHTLLGQKAWPPYICGALVGLLQIPIVFAVNDSLGGSSSYCTIVSQPLVGPLNAISPYLSRFKTGLANWWQVVYVGSAVFGAYVSSSLSSSHGSSYSLSNIQAFCGGIFMVFGARLASGCTSGHGLSGVGFLANLSLLATACMFAGGYIASLLINYF